MSPQEFAAAVDRLARDGFRFISVPRLERFVSDGTPIPPNAVCVVFDHGYEGIHRYALPVLEQHQISAAVTALSALRTAGDGPTAALLEAETRLLHARDASVLAGNREEEGYVSAT